MQFNRRPNIPTYKKKKEIECEAWFFFADAIQKFEIASNILQVQ